MTSNLRHAIKSVLRYSAIRIPQSAFLIFLAGCTVGPDYAKPPVAAPAAWKETGWKVAQPRDHLARGAWWKVFGDPQLDTLEESVNISNQNLIVAEAQYRQARALVQAVRAGYFPLVNGGASATWQRVSPNAAPMGGPSASFVNYAASGAASWEPDLWGRVARAVESAKASAQATAADIEAIRLSTQAELAQDYYQLRALDAERQIFDDTVASYRKFLQLSQYRYANGVAARGDVLVAETQLKTALAQAVDIGVQRAQLEHAIAVLAGKAVADFSIPTAPLLAPPPAAFSLAGQPTGSNAAQTLALGVPSELLERRPDVAAAERSAAAANAQIGVALSAYYPNITLSAAGGLEGGDLSHWLIWPSRFWSVGPGVTETLFDAGLRRAQTDQARAAYDAAVASYRQTVLAAFQDVEDNLAAIRILEEEALAQDEAVKASTASVDFTVNQYRQGTASALDVITIQTILFTNRRTAADILGRRMAACALLIKALGGGWDASSLPTSKQLTEPIKW